MIFAGIYQNVIISADVEKLTMTLERSTVGFAVQGELVVEVTNKGAPEAHRNTASQPDSLPIRTMVPDQNHLQAISNTPTTLRTTRSSSSMRLVPPTRNLPPLPVSNQTRTTIVARDTQPNEVCLLSQIKTSSICISGLHTHSCSTDWSFECSDSPK